MEYRLRRPSVDRLTAATARHPMVVVVGAAGVGKSALLHSFADARSWRTPRSLLDPEVLAMVGADPTGFLESLPVRCVLDDADVLADLPGLAASVIARHGGGRNGQLLISVSTRAVVPGNFPADAIVELFPLTQAELRSAGPGAPGGLGALFCEETTGWLAQPLSDIEYLSLALGSAGPAARRGSGGGTSSVRRIGPQRVADRLEDRDDALLRLIARRSGAWQVPAEWASALGCAEAQVLASLRRLTDQCRIRRLAPWRREADGLAGRFVVIDPVLVAKQYGFGARAVEADAVAGEARAALIRTLALNEVLSQNEWLRRPFVARTWQPAMGTAAVDLVLSSPTEGAEGAVGALAIAVHPEARFDNESGRAVLGSLGSLRRRHPGAFDRMIVLYLGPVVLELARDVFAVPLSLLWTDQPQVGSLGIGRFEHELSDAVEVLRRWRHGSGLGVAELSRHREAAQSFVVHEVAPLLGEVVRRLDAVGLAGAVRFDELDELELVLPGDGSAQVIAGASLHIEDPVAPSGSGWKAMVAAGIGQGGSPGWWIGHLTPGAGADRSSVVGRRGPLAGTTAAVADQLVAALVAGLADRAGALVGGG